MVLTVSFGLSPVTGLSCHRRLADTSAKLDASVGASGPHDLMYSLFCSQSIAGNVKETIGYAILLQRNRPARKGQAPIGSSFTTTLRSGLPETRSDDVCF